MLVLHSRSEIQHSQNMKKKLAVFDFDDTIINRSPEYKNFFGMTTLLPDQDFAELFSKNCQDKVWTISEAWEIFNDKTNVTKEDIIDALVKCVSVVKGMVQVLDELSHEHDLIMISHNDLGLIDPLLNNFKLQHYFKKVFAKPSVITKEGKFKKFKIPETWSGVCNNEPINHCKTLNLKEFLQENHGYDQIIYFGDGENDYCPAEFLSSNDKIFPRRDFPLEKVLNQKPVQAQVFAWSDGYDILKFI